MRQPLRLFLTTFFIFFITQTSAANLKAIEQELSTSRIPLMRKNMKALSEKVAELSNRLARLEQVEK